MLRIYGPVTLVFLGFIGKWHEELRLSNQDNCDSLCALLALKNFDKNRKHGFASYEICDVGQLLLWIGLQGATSLHSVHLCAAVLCRCQYCNALNTALSLAAVLSAFF
jgi:hypothetical protein